MQANPEIIANALSSMGFVGAVIAGLLLAIGALTTAVVILYRRINSLNDWNREENKAFIKLAESINGAMNRTADVNDDRNRVTEELASAVKAQAGAFELVVERLGHYHDANVERIERVREVVGSQSEATRTHTGIVSAARDTTAALLTVTAELKAKIDLLLTEAPMTRPRRPSRPRPRR